MKPIYLDNAATTKSDERVAKIMNFYLRKVYANPSSKYALGELAKKAIEGSKKMIANKICAKPSEIIFTSGGTESNNLALKGLFFANYPAKNHIITTKIEHNSVLNACKWLEEQGAEVTYLDVDKKGFVSTADILKAMTRKTFLVSIIHGNNEIGTIQDIEQIGKLCKNKGILFHTDACQSFTKIPIDAKKMNIDLMTINSHKIHGPKGVGALYIKDGLKIIPLLHGGGQEKGLRSGTENTVGIVGFAEAVKIFNDKDVWHMEKLQNKLINELLKISGVKLNGSAENRLCNNVNVSFLDIDAETLISYLENYGIYLSAGSACMSNANEKSHVLKAIGLSKKEIESSIRISLSKYNTEKEIDFFVKKLKEIIKKLKGIGIK